MAAPVKMDELLVSWLGSDDVYNNVLELIDEYRVQRKQQEMIQRNKLTPPTSPKQEEKTDASEEPTRSVAIPRFHPLKINTGKQLRRRRTFPNQCETWEPFTGESVVESTDPRQLSEAKEADQAPILCVRDQVLHMLPDLHIVPSENVIAFPLESFVRITRELCRFPSFFNAPLYQRILNLWNAENPSENQASIVTLDILEWFWKTEMEPFDSPERFFRLVKQPCQDCILRDDFLPFIKALLNDHPGLEFLSNHAEFQEKYAVTVITRIFYSINKCHSGRITSRQIRRSDIMEAFSRVDEEEDINKVTRYFSYEHFYVLYCRFWELDHDRDYRITREDLLKYGDHSLSHMIVDRIFDAAPRPFENDRSNNEFLSYEDFIFFMLSEEDKANEVSVRYWFSCVDVDGDGKLNNMEMRSFYAVQLHRMQCMGHEIVPFEDMLCQMMDMIKPKNSDYLVVEDFLQPECSQVSGALFDALFNLNKYLMFEQRDPFAERQKREDEFETDWDRFACIDYNRLAMEEEAREEEAIEIDWVTVDEDSNRHNEVGG
ncbi:unnamed protein product [Cylindrotheca closterium]|uniref:EF-hand domain-containing protein n=1 Tax=Cylindrotheca closterium TaxID=2856 RepID=A0AAD2PXG6_9STRA|nr:unnamed protein product [Cylindrotheca closterium]